MTNVKGFWSGGSNFDIKRGDVLVRTAVYQRLVQRPHSALIVGPRQSGKSTMLKMLAADFNQQGITSVYISFEPLTYSGTDDLDRKVNEHILKTIVRETSQSLNDVFAPAGDGGLPERSVLLFDEFTYVAEHAPNFISRIRGGIESRRRDLTVILADRTHPTNYLSDVYSPFNFIPAGYHFYLTDFSDAESAEFLQGGFSMNGITIDDSAVKELYKQTKGQPYLLQALGMMLTTQLLGERSYHVKDSNVEAAIETLKSQISSGTDDFFRTLSTYMDMGVTSGHGRVQFGNEEREALYQMLRGINPRFDLSDKVSGNLFTFGFTRPEYVREEYGLTIFSGVSQFRNPLVEHSVKLNRQKR